MLTRNFDRPNWQPLKKLIGSRCGELMWMRREGTWNSTSTSIPGVTSASTPKVAAFTKGATGLSPPTWMRNSSVPLHRERAS